MAVMVLLGAGASYGSKNVEPSPPPLGNKLFEELVEKGGEAASMPEFLKEKFQSNFEERMAAYFEHTQGDIMTFQRELAEHLASFKPLDGNVYIDLIKSLKPQRVIYSSLNYDLLFELAAAKLHLNTIYDNGFQNGYVRLLKIHGSSNFWPDIPMGSMKGCKIYGSGRADIQAPTKPLNQIDTLNRCRVEDSLAPAIAMFAVGKDVRVCPDYVEEQYAKWKEQIEKSSKVFIVGVRVHEVDEHIWGVLGKCPAKVWYFGFDGDKDEFDAWKAKHKKANAYFRKADFEASIDIIKGLA